MATDFTPQAWSHFAIRMSLRRGSSEVRNFSEDAPRDWRAHPVSFAPQVDAGYVAQNYRQAFDLSFPPGAAILTTTIWHRFPSPF
jgi:hypothetical protein